jgi:hypothetical protein
MFVNEEFQFSIAFFRLIYETETKARLEHSMHNSRVYEGRDVSPIDIDEKVCLFTFM